MRLLPWLLAALLAACGGDKPAERKGPPPTLITVTVAEARSLELEEHTLGSVEAINDPKVAAEVPGKIVEVGVRAGQKVRKGQLLARLDASDTGQLAAADRGEAARLASLLAQQERLVARQTELVQKQFISRNALDDAVAQRDALKNQWAAATARSGLSAANMDKTRVLAPFDGVIEEQWVAPGDYVKLGDPMFRLVANSELRANLPFPESTLPRLQRGQAVHLTSPSLSGGKLDGVIEDIRPTVSETARAVIAIARLPANSGLRSGASVNADVVTGRRESAVVVPEQSLVLRPAGRVVYVVKEGKAEQRAVEVGGKQRGWVEIVKGVKVGETVALDGAGFLTDGATVAVRDAGGKPAAQ